MDILIKAARVIDRGSPFDGQVVDILINNGIVKDIGNDIFAEDAEIVSYTNLNISIGWCDLRTHGRNPGYEHKEDFESLTNAAIAGGFTDIALLPNTTPIIESKESVSFIKSASLTSKVNFWPIAAATHKCEGKDLNELIDLHKAGAIGFSDGQYAISNTDTIIKILQYLGQINGVLFNHPTEPKMNLFGQMHEGLNSNLLGLKGMPAIAEQMAIQRDLNLLEYLGDKAENVRYHFSTISTAKSVELIKQAKQNGRKITCDVAAHHLIFTDEDLSSFDTNFKVMPPFRREEDRAALWEGLLDGTIDAIVSDHCPHDPETKNLEFDLSEFGAIGLETMFASVNKSNTKLRYPQLIEKLSFNPRKILGLPALSINIGQPAHFTLFDTQEKWTFELDKIQSKSKNSPFIGKNMLGKAIGVIVDGKLNYAK